MAKAPRSVARSLQIEAATATSLIANIRSVMDGFSKEDDPDAAMMIAEGETNLLEVIDKAVTRIFDLEDMSDALGHRAAQIAARKKRFDDQADLLRASVQHAMGVIEQRKLELAQATISIRLTAPSVTVTDEAMIPSEFWKPQPPKLDKKALLDALKARIKAIADAAAAGDTAQVTKLNAEPPIPGAVLSNGGETISIKAM